MDDMKICSMCKMINLKSNFYKDRTTNYAFKS